MRLLVAGALLLSCCSCVKKAAAQGPVPLILDCRKPGHRISPLIYGVAHSERSDPRRAEPWELGATAVRWGGNSSSRYNWELGNAWNAGSDWFFRNVDYSGKPGPAWRRFLEANRAHGLATAMTIPILGQVAKDATSAPPQKTSVPAPPEMMARWVEQIRSAGGAEQYILDNEPMLWNETHRDVHPQPVGYDELLDRTLRYGSAIRRADPRAVIAGPALWGWPAYFYSAIDKVEGFRSHPDRRAHGEVPLLPWYLRKLREHEKKTGERILDVVDVHFYPQGKGIGVDSSGDIDEETAARRVRSVRGLWDPSYRDESFIGEPIRLLPRLREWIDVNYPGRGISIGEYNFGADRHISGGLAVAEALGRFAEAGIVSAFYWTAPPRGSAAYWAFRAYRNYDGRGGRFEDTLLKTASLDRLSLFASLGKRRLVIVAVNARAESQSVDLQLSGCGERETLRQFTYAGGDKGFEASSLQQPQATLPALSISVIEVGLR